MGKKSILMVMGLGGLTGLLQIIGAVLPMHKLGLTLGGVKLYVMMDTYLTSVVIYGADEKYQDDVTGAIGKADPSADTSWFSVERMSGSYNLEDIRFHMCTALLKKTWGSLCDGFEGAYSCGIAVIVVLCTNLLCQATGCFLLYDYSTRKQNPKYREMSAGVILGGGAILLVVLIGYFFAALGNMNQMNSGILGEWVFQPSSASGATSGFIVLIMALIVQLLQGVLILAFTRNEFGEDDYWDKKEAREVGLEMGSLGMQPGQGGMQQGNFGIQPMPMQGNMMMQPGGMMVMQQPMGMQPMGMQPMGTPMMVGGGAAW